jgi:dTMP kinase
MKGIFITFEGGEGSGKSTQAKLLYKFLKSQKYKVILTKEPGGTKISNKIRKILLDSNNKKITKKTEILLYFASRAQHIEELIKPYLKKNYIVISDRFSDSTLAYQGIARGINLKIVEFIDNFVTEKIKPDLTFLLDLPCEVALKRLKNKNRIDRESLEFHKKVREGFLKIARKNKKRIKILNAEEDILKIHKKIKEITLNYLQRQGIDQIGS